MSTPAWKKPGEANKAPGNPPGSLPPWMKNKPQQPVLPPGTPVNNPVNTSSPVNTSNLASTGNPPASVPPWMKNKEGGQQPSIPVSKTPATSSNVPPWMRNKTSPNQTDRSKGEQQQKSKKMAEEKRILEEQQQQMLKQREKQKQAQNQNRQRKQMSYEDEYSTIWNKEAKQKQQENTKAKKTGTPSPKKKQVKSPTKRNIQQHKCATPFHKYLHALNLSCSKSEEYLDRLEHQKSLLTTFSQFSEESEKKLKDYLRDRKITVRKKNFINLQNVFVEYALVDGMTVDRFVHAEGMNTSAAVFRTKNIENMEQVFSLYQVMFNTIVKLIKRTTVFRLRVPLLSRVSYKGMEFMCEGICEELGQAIASGAQNYPQVTGELTQLQKQLKDMGYEHLNRKNFIIKKLTIESQQIFIIYFVQNLPTILNLHHHYHPHYQSPYQSHLFYPNIPLSLQRLTNLELIASSQLVITYTEISKLKEIKKSATPTFNKVYLQLFEIAHAIRVVYASCQGEVEEESFWNLVFENNDEVWKMISNCYESIYSGEGTSACRLQKRLLLSKILETMLPLKFSFKTVKGESSPSMNDQASKKKPVILASNAKHFLYPLQGMQLFEISNLFQKYLSGSLANSNKLELAQQSLAIQQEIIKISDEKYLKRVNLVKNKTNLLLKQWESSLSSDGSNSKFIEAIKTARDYRYSRGQEMHRVILYPLLMTLYMFEVSTALPIKREGAQQQQKEEEEQKSQKQQDQQKQENQQKQEQQQKCQRRQEEEHNEAKMLSYVTKIMAMISEYFETDEQIWAHAGIYALLAEYYSRKAERSQQPKVSETIQASSYFKNQQKSEYSHKSFEPKSPELTNSKLEQISPSGSHWDLQQFSSKNLTIEEPTEHPHAQKCIKLIEQCHAICLQFYGIYSIEVAEVLTLKGEIYLNLHLYSKCVLAVEESLKVYKSSSKHALNICECMFIIGQCSIENGRANKKYRLVEEGRGNMEKTGEQYLALGMELKAIRVYEYLYTDAVKYGIKFTKNRGQHKTEAEEQLAQKYLEKQAEIALSCKETSVLKKVVQRVINIEGKLYSRDKVSVLQQIYDQNLLEEQRTSDQILIDIEASNANFGSFIEMVRWSLGVLWFKNQSYEWERAAQIMKKLLSLFDRNEIAECF